MYISMIAVTNCPPVSLSFFIYLPNFQNITITTFPFQTTVFWHCKILYHKYISLVFHCLVFAKVMGWLSVNKAELQTLRMQTLVFSKLKKMWKLEEKHLAKNSRVSSNFYTNMATVRIYEMWYNIFSTAILPDIIRHYPKFHWRLEVCGSCALALELRSLLHALGWVRWLCSARVAALIELMRFIDE